MFFRLVNQLAEKEGVTEQLKADNQMLWVKRMNNIRNRATEIVNAELIYV
ncbi:Transposon-encoded protein TnpV [Ruminococcaceae bacterium P7]|nr:Transposon-encoded protein TnpV [Ruminococcaceae bacterium P7]